MITPTYQRPTLLARAIASVQAQTYGRWEMVVVDDGSQTAAEVIEVIGDQRVRLVEAGHEGPTAARNKGLDAAEGTIITYLDDDNTFDRGWLKAVAWAFQVHADSEVLYGARLIDDDQRVHGTGDGGWPMLHFEPLRLGGLELGNLADMGAIAHRAGLPEARFDERLWEYGDWDFLLSLTEHRTPARAARHRPPVPHRGHPASGAHPKDMALIGEKWSARRTARQTAQRAANLGRSAPTAPARALTRRGGSDLALLHRVLELLDRHEHGAGLRPLGGADHAPLLEQVHQAPGAGEARP